MNRSKLLLCVAMYVVASALALPSRASAQEGDKPKAEPADTKDSKKPKSRKGKTQDRRSGQPEAGAKSPEQKGGKFKVDMSPVPADEKAEKKAMKALGEGFKTKHTNHFSVAYNTSAEDAADFATAIERTYRSCMKYASDIGVAVKLPKRKLLIYYFDEFQQYNSFAVKIGLGPRPESNPGLYLPEANFCMFFNYKNLPQYKQIRAEQEQRLKQLREQLKNARSAEDRRRIQWEINNARAHSNWSKTQGGDVSESIVQHEVTHQIMYNIGFHNPKAFLANPAWFIEGTAMMFETIAEAGRGSNVGAVNKERLSNFRSFDGEGRLFPVDEMISSRKYLDFGSDNVHVFYAQSWALAHYINRTKKDGIKKFVKIINARPADWVPSEEKDLEAFEKAFGKMDEEWVRRWKQWMKKVN